MQFKRIEIEAENVIGFKLEVDVWAARKGQFSFLISKGEEGYAASYKDAQYEGPQSSIFIMNGDKQEFATFKDAVAACRNKWKELRLS